MKFLFVVPLLILSFSASAQFQEKITSDRPGQAMSAYTVGSQTIQFQNGINYGETRGTDIRTQNFSDALDIRYGLFEKVEVSLSGIFGTETSWLSGIKYPGGFKVSDLSAAARFKLLEGDGFIPNIAIRGGVSFFAQRVQQFGYFGRIATNNSWDWFSVSTNFGISYAGSTTTFNGPSFPYVLNLGFSLTDEIGAFVEMFGTFDNINFPSFDAGLAVVPIDDLQIDLLGGYGLGNNLNSWFVEIGLSYRLDWRSEN